MVDKVKDPDIIEHYREEFETFLTYRDDFREFLMLDQDILDGMIRLQELVKEDMEPNVPSLYKKFLNNSIEGFTIIEDYASVLNTNLASHANQAAEKVLEGIFLLAFLGLSKINSGGLPEVNAPKLDLDSVEKLVIPDPGHIEYPVSAEIPDTSELGKDDIKFQFVLTNGFRINVHPSDLKFYDEDQPIDELGHCYLVGNATCKDREGVEGILLKFTKDKIRRMGAYTVREFSGTTCLHKNINNTIKLKEEEMALINVTILDPIKFLEDPQVRLKRSLYVEKYSNIPNDLVISAQYKSSSGASISLGRWSLSVSENSVETLVFRPVRKTRKSLVMKVLTCFPDLSGTEANTAFHKYLGRFEEPSSASTKEIVKAVPPLVSNLPDGFLEARKGNQSFKVEYYDLVTGTFKTVKFVNVQYQLDAEGGIYIFSDSHNVDWKLAMEIGNKLVKINFSSTDWEAKSVREPSLKQLTYHYYDPEEPEKLDWNILHKAILFDEGLYMKPMSGVDGELTSESTKSVSTYDFKAFEIKLNGTAYYPNNSFKIHELSDLDGNIFLAFCKDNMQNWLKALDYKDFEEDFENTESVEVTVDNRDNILFTEFYSVGDYVFLFAGSEESTVYIGGQEHMDAYNNVYCRFMLTNPYRKGKLGLDKVINYTEVRRKTTVNSAINKVLVKPPKRATSEILF